MAQEVVVAGLEDHQRMVEEEVVVDTAGATGRLPSHLVEEATAEATALEAVATIHTEHSEQALRDCTRENIPRKMVGVCRKLISAHSYGNRPPTWLLRAVETSFRRRARTEDLYGISMVQARA